MSDRIETDRLIILTAKEEFATQLAQYYDRNREWFDPYEVPKTPDYYTSAYQLSSMRYEIDMMKKGQCMYYYVFLKEKPDTIIGTISYSRLRPMPYLSTVFGYDFDHAHWGSGYATESCIATDNDIFQDYGMHRIEARVSLDNDRSIRMLERLGFVYEGKEFAGVFIGGQWRDHLRYALIRPE
ncbi:MAG: GNAT family N-acetyltransferase [Lachnospiraceae bacterium]|nr:GNAT family N-acetyltransferase [Lachnospiraceae bacterium]